MSKGGSASEVDFADGPYAVRSVLRVLDVLDFVQDHPMGATLAEIALAVGVPKSTAFRYLATLESRRYVDRDAAGDKYRIGFGMMLQMPFQVLGARAAPYLVEIRDRFDETASLGILDRNRVLYVRICESSKTMRLAARQGDHDPLHSTALGKVIAGQLTDDEVRRILSTEGMTRFTPETLDEPEAYLREVHLARKRGWASDNGENELGGRCIAVPLVPSPIPAGISFSAPAMRLPANQTPVVAAALMSAATRLGDELAYRP